MQLRRWAVTVEPKAPTDPALLAVRKNAVARRPDIMLQPFHGGGMEALDVAVHALPVERPADLEAWLVKMEDKKRKQFGPPDAGRPRYYPPGATLVPMISSATGHLGLEWREWWRKTWKGQPKALQNKCLAECGVALARGRAQAVQDWTHSALNRWKGAAWSPLGPE